MTLAEQLAPHIADLRQYARAATGSPTSGDRYVASVIRRLIESVSERPQHAHLDRSGLLRLLIRALHEPEMLEPGDRAVADWERSVARRLAEMPPLARHAFLLTTLEKLDTAEVARILDISVAQARRSVSQAGRLLATRLATDILLIEDEPLVALELEQVVTSLGHRIVGIARTRDEAVEMFDRHQPQMVLADIRLADGSSGLDAISQMLDRRSVPVIFVTVYPDRLAASDCPDRAIVVEKPFDPDALTGLINSALFFDERATNRRVH